MKNEQKIVILIIVGIIAFAVLNWMNTPSFSGIKVNDYEQECSQDGFGYCN